MRRRPRRIGCTSRSGPLHILSYNPRRHGPIGHPSYTSAESDTVPSGVVAYGITCAFVLVRLGGGKLCCLVCSGFAPEPTNLGPSSIEASLGVVRVVSRGAVGARAATVLCGVRGPAQVRPGRRRRHVQRSADSGKGPDRPRPLAATAEPRRVCDGLRTPFPNGAVRRIQGDTPSGVRLRQSLRRTAPARQGRYCTALSPACTSPSRAMA